MFFECKRNVACFLEGRNVHFTLLNKHEHIPMVKDQSEQNLCDSPTQPPLWLYVDLQYLEKLCFCIYAAYCLMAYGGFSCLKIVLYHIHCFAISFFYSTLSRALFHDYCILKNYCIVLHKMSIPWCILADVCHQSLIDRRIILKLLRTSDKMKFLKAAREKRNIRGTKIRIITDFPLV